MRDDSRSMIRKVMRPWLQGLSKSITTRDISRVEHPWPPGVPSLENQQECTIGKMHTSVLSVLRESFLLSLSLSRYFHLYSTPPAMTPLYGVCTKCRPRSRKNSLEVNHHTDIETVNRQLCINISSSVYRFSGFPIEINYRSREEIEGKDNFIYK